MSVKAFLYVCVCIVCVGVCFLTEVKLKGKLRIDGLL